MKFSEEKTLEVLKSLKENVFHNNSINTSAQDKLSLELRKIPKEWKSKFFDFVKDYIEACFAISADTGNINLEDFAVSIEDIEIAVIEEEIKEEKKESLESLFSFKVLFEKVKKDLKEYFKNYKGYFITQLINEYSLSYDLIFIYEDENSMMSMKTKVKSLFENTQFLKLGEEENIQSLDQNKNYLCIFLLVSKVNNLELLEKQIFYIDNFIKDYENFEYHTLINHYSIKEKKELFYEKSNNGKDLFIEDVKNFSSMFLSNMRLNFEEEKLIKKICERIKSNLIFYKILAGGFSGSKVIEIRPKRNFNATKIYIIKLGLIEEGKIDEEKQYYDLYVPDGQFTKYRKPAYLKTLLYEGLMYDYAISNEAEYSYSFSDYLNKEVVQGIDLEKMTGIIEKLYSNELFDYWKNEFAEKKKNKVSEVYKDYLSKKIIEESLRNIIVEESEIQAFLYLFNNIWDYELNYNEIVCHGDLHTDNFFIDNTESIFLIDFGHTKNRHSLIDFVALECSLKFKHFPFHIDTEELMNIEKNLLSKNSFDLNYDFNFTKRENLLFYIGIINKIRNCSKVNMNEDGQYFEYFIALFVMSIRQIRYSNMNQRYAYHSAKLLGEYILKELNL